MTEQSGNRRFPPIHPRPLGGINDGDEDDDDDDDDEAQTAVEPITEPASRERKRRLHTACEPCRGRKIRCDGKRPQCERCRRRTRKCVYGPSQKKTYEEMRAEIRELRAELEARREARSVIPGLASMSFASPVASSTLTNPFDIEKILHFLQANIASIEKAFTYFNGCTDFLFYSYSQSDAAALLTCIRQARSVTKPLLCQVCSMAAVGACFSRGEIPAELGDIFYSVAQLYLDDCLEKEPENVIKVCALLAARNIVLKATVALAYIELGLVVSRKLGLSSALMPPTISTQDWVEKKRVWRCLVTLEYWLQTTLGWCTKSKSDELTWADIELESAISMEDSEFFQQAMARIAVLKHKMLKVLPATEDAPPSYFAELNYSLQKWYDHLPADARVSNIINAPINSTTRFKLYYLHLSHLGTRMLLFRCLVRRYDIFNQRGVVLNILDNSVEGGLAMARQSARLSYLMYSEGGAVRHCWLCIFQAHVACCILLHLCFQKVLRNRIDKAWDEDLTLVNKLLEILTFCGELDGVARSFHKTLAGYLGLMKKAIEDGHLFHPTDKLTAEDLSRGISSASEEHLVLLLALGKTAYHNAAVELFKLVAWPFGGGGVQPYDQNVDLKHTLINHEEITLGVHAEWAVELNMNYDNNQVYRAPGSASEFISQSFGRFVGSDKPSGWNPSQTHEGYQEGALTLDFMRLPADS